jgi:hypothetical protein
MHKTNTLADENLAVNPLKHIFNEFTEWKFWWKVHKREPDECWPWLGGKSAQGYGQFCIKSKPFLTHRLAWMFTHQSAVPDGKRVILKCRNRRCCNPAHIAIGTHKDQATTGLKSGSIKNEAYIYSYVPNVEVTV